MLRLSHLVPRNIGLGRRSSEAIAPKNPILGDVKGMCCIHIITRSLRGLSEWSSSVRWESHKFSRRILSEAARMSSPIDELQQLRNPKILEALDYWSLHSIRGERRANSLGYRTVFNKLAPSHS